MPTSIWKTWNQIKKDTVGRAVYLYGRSEDWVHKAIKGYGGKIVGIVDRDSSFHNTKYYDLNVLPIEKVNHNENLYFIITAGDFGGIVDALEAMGYVAGDDFCCSPDFRDYEVLERLKAFSRRILVSSSDYNDRRRARSSWLGGGFYVLDLQTGFFEKKAEGSFRQFEVMNDGRIIAIEYVEKKIQILNRDYIVEKSIDLDLPNYCGLSVCEETGNLSIVNAGTDEILTFSTNDWSLLNRRMFRRSSAECSHHLNDCQYHEGKLYCSYFSYSGGYKIDVFDGGVACFDPLSNDEPTEILKALWKPHSPKFLDGKIFALDSMRGKVVSGKPNFNIKMPGFVRGLDKYLQYLVVGQSEDMYVSERMGKEAIMLSAGVYLHDMEYNASRFIPINGLMNIHDLKILEE